MKFYFVNSVDTQLIFSPENEVERVLLESLLKQELSVDAIAGQMNIVGKPLTGGIIIQKAGKVVENQERQSGLKLITSSEVLEEVS